MPLGKPSIATPRALELRVIAQAVENIRQRIEAIESQTASTAAQAGETTLRAGQQNISITALRAQIVALTARVDALATTDTELETFRASSAIAVNTTVYPTGDGLVAQVDPSDPVKVYAALGVATQAVAAGANVVVRKAGVMQIADAVFEPGGPVFVGVAGLTQFPDYINLAIPVGVATGTDEIDVRPGWPALQYPGVHSDYETFLPPTFGLVRDAVTLAQDFNSAVNGLVVRIGPDNVTTRSIEAGGNLVVEDGDGVNDNPLIYDIPISDLPIRSGGLNGHEAVAVDAGDGSSYQVTVQDIADLAGSGSGSVTSVGITQPVAGITATGGPITSSGSITLALANDLAALEGLGSTGLAVRTGSDAWAQRSVAGTTNRITVTNGDGVSGNPTVDIAATYVGQTSITVLGTVGTGVWQGTAVAADFGGTGFTSYAVGDILYASTTTALSKLADVATGNVLNSGGVGVAPSWGKVGLTTHVSGTLGAANGGTGVANASGSTITLGGALTLSGAFTTTLTVTANTSVTLPTSGTLATTAQLPTAANPSATVGLAAVNGSASTFMRSDGAPALDQGIVPTWTGFHTFTANPTALPASPVSAAIHIAGTDAGVGTSILVDTFGGAGVMAFRRSGGTAASPTSITSGQGVFNLQGFGYAGSGYTATAPAVLSFNANENWSGTNQGSRAQFLVTPNGSTGASRVLAWQLTAAAMILPIDNQEVQIGAGNDLRLYHDGTDSYIENDTGNLVLKVNGELSIAEVTTTTTAPSAGGAGALPAAPAGYVTVIINGTTRQLPYY